MLDPSTLATTAVGSSAEAQATAFADNDRIHLDRNVGAWRLEDDDGNEIERAARGTWVSLVSTDVVARSSPKRAR